VESSPFSFSGDKGDLIIKLALSFGPTPARWTHFANQSGFFMAFNALRILVLAEGFFPVVADPAMLVLPVSLLGHFEVLFLHGENLGMAVGAFRLLRCHVVFMAENDWIRPFGGELDVPSPDLLRLGKSNAQDGEADDTDGDNRNLPSLIPQFSSPFQEELIII
jgi:hypothetical protein